MEFKQYLQFLWRWSILIVTLATLCGSVAFFTSQRKDLLYESTATVLVNRFRTDPTGPTFNDLITSERRAITFSILLKKRSVLDEVIKNLNIKTDPGSLASRVNVEFLRDTELIVVAVQDKDRERAAAVANEIVKVFNEQEAALLANPYAASIPSLHIVEPARPGNPIPSDAQRNLILGGVVGVLLAIVIGMIIDMFDDRVRSSDTAEQITGIPTLATIGRIKGSRAAQKLITATQINSPIAETYRMFRGHLELLTTDKPLQTIVVTSGATQEGRSTTIANTAVGLAQTGKRVILVDADMRRPMLHSFFGIQNAPGLSHLLTHSDGQVITEYLLPTGIENLRLLPGGPIPPNPSKLLASATMGRLIDSLRVEADIILFDSPALLTFVDATLLLQACDATLLVVHAGRTRAVSLKKTAAYLSQSRARLLGTILNCARVARSRNYSSPTDGDSGRRQRATGETNWADLRQSRASSATMPAINTEPVERQQLAE